MIDFNKYPTYDKYRPLYWRRPPAQLQVGADVFALQHAINSIMGSALKTDGALGEKTDAGIGALQAKLGLVVDKHAGPKTQTAICLTLLAGLASSTTETYRICRGQLEHESSYRVGNYSAKRQDPKATLGWSYDAGAAQLNTALVSPEVGFNPREAIGRQVIHLEDHFMAYADTSKYRGTDHSQRRRWLLAAGSWNAPAWTNWLAGVKPDDEPDADQRATLEAYMSDVTIYL